MSFNNVNVNVSGPVQPTSTYKTKVLKGNHSFASQVTEPNMKYVIKHDFDLGDNSVTIPEGCLLEFEGGAISNGTLVGQSTILIYNQPLNDILTATLEGTWRHESGVKADEEDITDLNGELKFKDKAYAPANYSGLGRKILRKNIVDGVNTLTQEMISAANTIYVIQYDFNLNGESVTIPENCVLNFDGGSLMNGELVGQNTAIEAGLVKIFEDNVVFEGTWNVAEAYPEWFGAKHSSDYDARIPLQKTLDLFGIAVITDNFYINSANDNHNGIVMSRGCCIKSKKERSHAELIFNTGEGFVLNAIVINSLCTIENIIISGHDDDSRIGTGIINEIGTTVNSNKVKNVRVQYFDDGIHLNTWLTRFEHVEVYKCNYGIIIQYSDQGEMTSCTLIDCYVRNVSNVAYYFDKVIYSSLINCACDLCGATSAGVIEGVQAYAYYFNGCKNIQCVGIGGEENKRPLVVTNCIAVNINGHFTADYAKTVFSDTSLQEHKYININNSRYCVFSGRVNVRNIPADAPEYYFIDYTFYGAQNPNVIINMEGVERGLINISHDSTLSDIEAEYWIDLMTKTPLSGTTDELDNLKNSYTKQIGRRFYNKTLCKPVFYDGISWNDANASPIVAVELSELFTSKLNTKYTKAVIKKIKGCTLKFNQKATTVQSVASSVASITNGCLTLNGTVSTGALALLQMSFVQGHKYFIAVKYISGTYLHNKTPKFTNGYSMRIPITGGVLYATSSGSSSAVYLESSNGATYNNYKLKLIVVDVTEMYGEGNEPLENTYSTLFDVNTYPFNPSGLYHFNIDSLLSVSDNGVTLDKLSLLTKNAFPTGMKSCGKGTNFVFDEINELNAIQRVGIRAYTSGDENDDTVTTDGTYTTYPLTSPVVIPFILNNNLSLLKGCKEYVYSDVITTPFNGDISYEDVSNTNTNSLTTYRKTSGTLSEAQDLVEKGVITEGDVGFQYFNTDTHKTITWDGTKWYNPDGTEAVS